MSRDSEKGLAVLVEPPKPDFSYGDIQTYHLSFVTIDQKNQVRNCSDSAYGEEAFTAPFADLMFRCQGYVRKAEPVYAYSIAYYSRYCVELADCESMLKMLRRIAKIKFPVQPATFGQYVQMTAMALGVTDAVQGDGKGGWHYNNEYRFWKVTDLQWLVDRMIEEFVRPYREATNAA